MLNQPLIMAGFLVLGVVMGYVIRYSLGVRRINSLESKLKEDIRRSKNESQEIILEAKIIPFLKTACLLNTPLILRSIVS